MQGLRKSIFLMSLGIAGILAGPSAATAGASSDSGTITYAIHHIGDQVLAGGSVLSRDEYKGVMTAKNAATPFNNAAHDCLGSLVVIPNKGPPLQINGVCDGVDKDGDVFWMSYHDEGDTHSWTFMGGTGKFQGLTGSGTTSQISMSPTELVIGWEGNWTMK